MPEPGPWSKRIYATYYARCGRWAPGLFLVLKGDPIPKDLQDNAERLRKAFLKEQARREAEDDARRAEGREVKVTWVKETIDETNNDDM